MKISNLVEKKSIFWKIIKILIYENIQLGRKSRFFGKKLKKIKYLDFFCDFSNKPQKVVAKQVQFVFLLLTRFVSGYFVFHKTRVDFI